MIENFGTFVILGERHGNDGGPRALEQLATEFLDQAGAVTVALEAPVEDDDTFERFLSGAAGIDELLEGGFFGGGFDGRANTGVLALLQRLRTRRLAGDDIRVVGCVRSGAKVGGPRSHEQRMADALAQHAEPARPLIVLVGNLHARLIPFQVDKRRRCTPMAARISNTHCVDTVELVYAGGRSWAVSKGLREVELKPRADQDPSPGLRRSDSDLYHWEWGIGEVAACPRPRDGADQLSSA